MRLTEHEYAALIGEPKRREDPAQPPEWDPSEADFDAAIVELCKVGGWLTWHTYDSRRSEPGWPDRVFARRGVALFRELKTRTGVVTPEQQECLALLSDAGVDAGVWRPQDWEAIVGELT